MRYELRDGRLWREGQPWFAVGVNYHPSSVGIRLWESFPEAEISDDLDAIASAGLTLVRIFVYWADLEPTLGTHSTAVLERVRRFCELAEARGLGVLVSALTVWMNGQRFYPEWLAGRAALTDTLFTDNLFTDNLFTDNLFTDKTVRERAKAAVAAIAAAGAPSGAVVAYDLGDELPHADPRSFQLSPADVAAWQSELADAIRAADPCALVTQANEASSVFGSGPFGPHNKAGLDFAAVHGFPCWGPETISSNRDPIASLLPSFLAAYSRAYGPVLVDEIGTYLAEPEVRAGHLRASLASLAAAGALGAVVWSWKDIVAPGAPYEQRPSERLTGLVDHTGRPGPALHAVASFAAQAATLWSQARRQVASTGIFLPQLEGVQDGSYLGGGGRSGLAAFHAFVLCTRAHLPTEVTRFPQPHHLLIICPSPDRLTEADAEVLGRAARAGATVLASVGHPGGGLLGPDLSGVVIEDFTPGRRHQRFGYGGHHYDLDWQRQDRTAVLRSVGADVLACFEDSSPALTRFSVGAGQVWTLNAPFERQFTDSERVTDDGSSALYRAVADAAGVEVPVRADCPDIEVQLLDIGGRSVVLLVNHSWADVAANITDSSGSIRRIAVAGKSSLLLDEELALLADEEAGRQRLPGRVLVR